MNLQDSFPVVDIERWGCMGYNFPCGLTVWAKMIIFSHNWSPFLGECKRYKLGSPPCPFNFFLDPSLAFIVVVSPSSFYLMNIFFIYSTFEYFIGEYISLYHHQRALLQQRETQKNEYISHLARDREEIQVFWGHNCSLNTVKWSAVRLMKMSN